MFIKSVPVVTCDFASPSSSISKSAAAMVREESPAPSYRSTERTPLLPNDTKTVSTPRHTSSGHGNGKKRQESISTKMVIIIAVLVLLGPLCGFLGALVDRMVAADPADPRARRRIRQEWDARIKKYHQEEHDLIEKREQIIKDYERRDAALFQRHERAIEDYKRQEAQLIWRREQRIDDFRREEAEWKRKIDRFEEELKEKVERERRERELARLYWVDVTGDEHCIANGRKSYTARLANLSGSINGVEACKATPITINGITYQKPITCEQARWGGSVHGRWVADNEAVCAAFWEVVNRKGCTAPNSGFRRIEAKLGGVHGGENAETLCLTTPLTINGQTYERPMACPYWGIFSGYWAVWDIPDEHCR